MSVVLDNLNNVLKGVLENKDRMNIAIKQAEVIGNTVSPDVQTAIDLLVETFSSNVQQIGQIIGSQLQLKTMRRTSVEVDVLVAGLQTLIAKEELLSATQTQMEVNAQPQAPLSNAAGSSELPAANDAAPASPAAIAPGDSQSGLPEAPGSQIDGASGS